MIPTPRNLASLSEARARGQLDDGAIVVVSFVGPTQLDGPHVFVDGGKRYDWGFAEGRHAIIVTRPGIDTTHSMRGLFKASLPYPTFVDFDRQIAASIVDTPDGKLKLWPRRRGSPAWRELFD